MVGLGALVVLCMGVAAAIRMGSNGLPYRDHFAKDSLSEWKVYGGDWSVASGELTNASDDTGAKAVTGDPRTADMTLDADVRLTSSFGDAGLLVRVSDEEEGTNAFHGYYAGIRLPDQLLLSRMDFGFTPLRRVQIAQGVRAGTWYHMTVWAQGCRFTAEARDMSGKVLARAEVEDDAACMRKGRFGLRSFAAGGSWRNVQARARE